MSFLFAEREICQPNPCQFGTKCVETGEGSYSCVKSMCHPNPCQNSGKCINVNQNNYKCACTADYQGETCEGKVFSEKQNHLSRVKSGTKDTKDIDSLLLSLAKTLKQNYTFRAKVLCREVSRKG